MLHNRADPLREETFLFPPNTAVEVVRFAPVQCLSAGFQALERAEYDFISRQQKKG